MSGSAVISEDGVYRYILRRRLDEERDYKTLTFIMLNPSTADDTTDDPTIRRCVGFAKREGCNVLAVVNLYALRATNPREILHNLSPIGPFNKHWIGEALKEARASGNGVVVCAWGANAPPHRWWPVVEQVREAGCRTMCFGVTKNGSPRHPLYVKGNEPLAPFFGAVRHDRIYSRRNLEP